MEESPTRKGARNWQAEAQSSITHNVLIKIWKLLKKMWYIYTMEYDSTIKRTKLVNNGDVDEARICHTEWSQKNKISRRSSWPRDWTQVSRSVGRHFAVWATREVAVSETQVQSLGWEICWRRKQQPTPLFLPGKYHGQRSQASYSPWGCKESDMT